MIQREREREMKERKGEKKEREEREERGGRRFKYLYKYVLKNH